MNAKKTIALLVAGIICLAAILPYGSMVKAAADAPQFAAEMELLISAEDYVEANPIVRDWIDEELVKAQARFSEMSIDELNNYIDQQVVNGQVGLEALSAITGVEPSVLIRNNRFVLLLKACMACSGTNCKERWILASGDTGRTFGAWSRLL